VEVSGFSLFYNVRTSTGVLPASAQWVPWVLSSLVKRLGHEAEHSAPSKAEVKNGGAIPPLHGVVLN
jgi:hypothetical protein